MLFKEGDVLEVELVLKVLGAGGDDDALTGEDRGDQVGKGLAGAGAGFDDQVLSLDEGALDRFGHLELAGPVFVVRVPLGEQAFFAEELADGEGFGGLTRGLGHLRS